ncbi:Conserved protein of unknown function, putative phiRV1 phage protein (fragment) [Mycobacterium canettii CIPT 140070017]
MRCWRCAGLLVDAVQQLNAAAYVNGSGTGQPTGFVSALTGTAEVVVPGVGSEAVVAADPYALQSALPPRFQANSAFAANLTSTNVLRQEETTNGALKFPSLQDNPADALRQADLGSLQYGVGGRCGDRHRVPAGARRLEPLHLGVEATIELIPHVFGPNRRPTGQRGFFCWFRTGSDVLTNEAFRVLSVATSA